MKLSPLVMFDLERHKATVTPVNPGFLGHGFNPSLHLFEKATCIEFGWLHKIVAKSSHSLYIFSGLSGLESSFVLSHGGMSDISR